MTAQHTRLLECYFPQAKFALNSIHLSCMLEQVPCRKKDLLGQVSIMVRAFFSPLE